MKKLRLLLFSDCQRNCSGCCNKRWDLDSLSVCTSFKGYEEIMLTGGEPMLKPELVLKVIQKIRIENKIAKIYMYTAKVNILGEIYEVLEALDGITVTLHEQKDVEDFISFNSYYWRGEKSLRLHVFEGIKLPKKIDLEGWKVRLNQKWVDKCPLPSGEVFMRLGDI